jgi:hypothetical protein
MHRAFWNREPQPYPLAALRVAPDFFFARHFEAAACLLSTGLEIHPDMIDVDSFMPEYERMFDISEELGQDAFWVAEPYTGIPWMEAMLGCSVFGGVDSITTRQLVNSLDEISSLNLDSSNPWLRKYLEFTEKLVSLSKGRFPIGMPIMRGPSDVVGAIMGQTEMIFALSDQSERMKLLFTKVAIAFRFAIDAQNALIPSFHGGSALGFYHVYCPGPSIWYQEDLSAIMSPDLYREFLAEPERRICSRKAYTAIHLHPSSFFLLDELLEKEDLKAIEVNKDVGGLSVEEMIPFLRKIQAKKSLILWGDFNEQDIVCIKKQLTCRGLFLHIIAPSMETAKHLRDQVRTGS